MPLPSFSELIQQLRQRGYHLADTVLENAPAEALQATDWHFDVRYRVFDELNQGRMALVIAVSSAQRQLKLLFVEFVSGSDANAPRLPLLNRLFMQTSGPGLFGGSSLM